MKNKNQRSIRLKLLFLFAIIAFIAISISSVAIFLHSFEEKKANGVKSLSRLTNIMSKILENPVNSNDNISANEILLTLKFHDNIEGAFIFKDNNVLFSSYIRTGSSKQNLQKTILDKYRLINITKNIEHIDVDYILIIHPIYSNNRYLGSLSILSNTHDLKKSIENQFFMQLLVSFFTFFIVIILAYKLQKIFTLPIFKLKETMENISLTSNYTLHVEHKTDDEFQVLFDKFDNMIDTIYDQDQQIKETQKHIRESIEYASLIQGALIPDKNILNKYFIDNFVIWKPKDIVGGDIYLVEEIRENELLIFVIDCTGHGVPGAFVTMLVKAIERQITAEINNNNDEIISPAKILSLFNKNMKQLLKQEDKKSISNAGFDGQVFYYNKKEKTVKLASARNEVFYIQNDTLQMIKGDRHSVGYRDSDSNYEFKEHTIDVSQESIFYLSTDGYWDQNSEEKGFPFGKKRFKTVINELYKKDMINQKIEFIKSIEKYQGSTDRNDDITLIGLKI